MTRGLDRLSARQRTLLDRWLPAARVERDLSWGLTDTTVLDVTHAGSRFVVKAGGDADHHIERELHAHRNWLQPWTSRGRAAALVHGDVEAKLLVTRYLPGELVLGSVHADRPATYRQAGELLALLHAQTAVVDDDYETRENDKALAWLDGPHRIAPPAVRRLREQIASWPAPAAVLVPTHGDWQPRNWLVHEQVVSVIDLGRAALRPAMTDLARLTVQEFRRDPDLAAAFLAGYGPDPREARAWHRTRVREAVGTAAWAHRVGDDAFEAQGHRMIADVLALSQPETRGDDRGVAGRGADALATANGPRRIERMPDTAVTIIRGARVTLRVAREDDVAALLAILDEPAVRARWGAHDEARVREDLTGDDDGFAIVVDGAVAGWIGGEVEDEPDYRHVGIDLFLTTRLHAQGLGREAIRLLVRHYAGRGHHRFTIDPAADNEPAIRAYTAVGFKPVGRLRAYERGPDGTWHDGLLMDLLADELIE